MKIQKPNIEIMIDRSLARLMRDAVKVLGWDVEYLDSKGVLEQIHKIAIAGERPAVPILMVLSEEDMAPLIDEIPEFPPEISALVIARTVDIPQWAARFEIADFVARRSRTKTRSLALARAANHTARRHEMGKLLQSSAIQGKNLDELNEIGVALSNERNLDKLLDLIVTRLRGMTSSDGGSLYLVELDEDSDESGSLFFKVAQNDTLAGDFRAFRLPIDRHSISGYVALSGNVLQIQDVYELPEDVEYQYNRGFDEANNYRSKSQLVVPMKNHDEDIIGVVQLINKKTDFDVKLTSDDVVAETVVPYTDEDVALVSSLASQAAVAIENAQLYEDLNRQFESFIFASVSAIEQRDPTTAGHSERVAKLTVGLAEAVNRTGAGALAKPRFSDEQIQEIYYAGLLHDFGKIGVKEDVLVKAKKLYNYDMRHIEDRFRLIRKTMELTVARQVIDKFVNASHDEAIAEKKRLDKWLGGELETLNGHLAVLRQANEPSVLPEDAAGELAEMLNISVEDPDGDPLPLLTQPEFTNLSIPKGSLNNEERLEIESHVSHTYRFLQLIPWTSDLKNVADIAYGHHEKLDGSGYPRGVSADDIPLQTRMMTISDIFDALTATDRPYKRAIPLQRALDILKMEVDDGKLDLDLYQLFLDAKVFEKVPAGQDAA